jgi:gliding motility-associated-like protein
MRSYIIYFLLFILTSSAYAQKEGAYWYFGNRAGLNFNSGQPVPIQDGKLQTLEGSATISDRNGNLLFYTNGTHIYDRNHQYMPNGSELKGNNSSTQSAIVVPKPGDPTIYYIITVDKPDYTAPPNDPIEGVNYSVVDMSLNNGFGDIISGQKNIHLLTYDSADAKETEYKSSEKISAVIHGDCESYWVATQFTNKFYAFKISQSGFDTNPVITTVPTYIPPTTRDDLVNKTAIGYMKFSSDGSKLAIAHSTTILGGGPRSGSKKNGKVLLYSFDDFTGKFDNEQTILSNSYPYGVEFSPKGTKLYVTSNIYDNNDVLVKGEVYQFDLESSNIPSSQFLLNSTDGSGGALQLAMDGKIYKAGHPSGVADFNFLSVINEPEKRGAAANFKANEINISPGIVEMGLPQFIQSLIISDFSFKELCLGDETLFAYTGDEPFDYLEWDFGDGSTSQIENAKHRYTQTGDYRVTLTRFINNIPQNPVCKQVSITANPVILKEYELYQCDLNDDDPEDGLAEFNLQLSKNSITLGDGETQIYFYESLKDAEDDLDNQNSLNIVYRNKSRKQIVYAKVVKFNSICYDIAEVTLITKDGLYIEPSPAKGCDSGNGRAEFDFDLIEEKIKEELGLPASVHLTFHINSQNAAVGINPLPNTYISYERTIYIRADDKDICYGSGSLELKISSFPDLQNEYNHQLCTSDFPFTLRPSVVDNNYSYLWNTGETSTEIEIFSGGTYTLEMKDEELGCAKNMIFKVEEFASPEIIEIEMQSTGPLSELTVVVNSILPPLYALDNIDGPYQTEAVFRDVSSGEHTIFVKDENECNISQQQILVFGYPKFITPNKDGYNDTWKPYKVADPEFKITEIYIYDRYGKLLKQLDPNGAGWDGTFNNMNMPSADYWFKILLQNGKEFNDHFSLIR